MVNKQQKVLRKSLKKDLSELEINLNKFITDEIDVKKLKHFSAQFGIYQQRDKKFMVRLRVTGNRVTAKKLQFIRVNLLEKYKIDYCRLTTRQDIQLHGVKAENIMKIINDCNNYGLLFNGGGGDTVRNILMSENSGVAAGSVFDVQPFVEKLWDIVGSWDNAFHMPRKFKIGVFAGQDDLNLAKIQDLGLVAKIHEGKYGFRVFTGGGLGSRSYEAIELFDFLEATKIVRLIKAMLNLFNDHGNREKRSQARLRYIKEKLGASEFKKLCLSYYENCELKDDVKVVNEFKQYGSEIIINDHHVGATPSEDRDFLRWQSFAVSDTLSGESIKSVKLYIKKGNLTATELELLENIVKKYSLINEDVNISYSQNFILPFVDEKLLFKLYNDIKSLQSVVDFAFNSFVGQVRACVGASVCSIGIVNSQIVAEKIAKALDLHFAKKLQSGSLKDAEILLNVVNNIAISGCPNCCARHVTANIGMNGCRRKIAGEVVDIYKIITKNDERKTFADNEVGEIIEDDVAEKILSLLG